MNPSLLQKLTLNRLVIAIVFLAIFTMAIRYPADSDTWWHLLAGQTMIDSQGLLMTDPFSHTKAGQPWINHGWLAQLFWATLLNVGGWTGLGLGLASIVTLSFWLVWLQSEGNLYIKAFCLILGAVTSSIVWAARPQMISFLLVALTAFLLNRFKRHQKPLLPWIPLIILAWVNIHGGFAIAFILLICYIVGELFNHLTAQMDESPKCLTPSAWKHLLLTFIISLAVIVINPNTWQMWFYPFRTVGIGVLRNFIAEWQSPNFHQPIIQPFLAMVLLLLAAIARGVRKVDWTDLALIGAWITLSLFAVRNIAIFALVCTPILIRYSTLALEDHFGPLRIGRARVLSRPLSLLNWAILALVLLGASGQIINTLSPTALSKAEETHFPKEAVTFIQQNAPAGPLFNSYNIGGYLLYHLWPDYPIFVDGRTDLYDDAFLKDYLKSVNALPDWQNILSEHNIHVIVLEKNLPLAIILQKEPNWHIIFEDSQVIIFEKK